MCLAIKGKPSRVEYMGAEPITDLYDIKNEFNKVISKLIVDRPILYNLNNIVLDTKEKGINKSFVKNVSLYYKGLLMLNTLFNFGLVFGLREYDKKQLLKEVRHNLNIIDTALNRETSKAEIIKTWCYFEFYKCDNKYLIDYLLLNLNYNDY